VAGEGQEHLIEGGLSPREVVEGDLVLVGPNGAGKTTTIRILATLLRPDRGVARVLGRDVTKDADYVRSATSPSSVVSRG
jgi:ABC-2 type transport system ATP-binding protein